MYETMTPEQAKKESDFQAKIGGLGASEIAKLFTGKGLAAKTAHTLILEKCEEIINGFKKNITTAPMQHGIFNEDEAFYQVVEPSFPAMKLRSSDSIWINDSLWATPDCTDDENGITIDIKCPYTIASFFTNINKLPDSYIVQNQCQMMATGHKQGYVCVYLTSNKTDTYGNKIEYDIDINLRHKFIPIIYDETYGTEIIERHEQFLVKRDELLETLQKANEINDIEFFNIHGSHKVTRLKDKSNIFAWQYHQLVRNNNTFYTIEKNK